MRYPHSKKIDHVDVLHGVEVPDPYRWLEDLDSEETRAWVEAQNEVTFGYLRQLPERDSFRQRLTDLWNYERCELPVKEGGRYFYGKNNGLQNQNVIYVAECWDAAPRVLLDPNTLSEDGTVAVTSRSVTEDGRLMAYGISRAGSDWQELRVRDVDTGQDLPDRIEWVKFSGASWAKDGSGFYYSRYNPPKGNSLSEKNLNQKLYFHRLGTPQSEDVLVYERPDQPEWGLNGGVTDDGRFLIIHVWQGTFRENRILVKRLDRIEDEVIELLPEGDASYRFVDNDGDTLWFYTEKDAPMGRLVAIDLDRPQPEHWRTILPESKDLLMGVSCVGGRFIASYLRDAHARVSIHYLDGTLDREFELPGIGSVSGSGGRRDDPETFFAFTSYTTPATLYRYNVVTDERTVFHRPQVAFDSDAFETKQVFLNSKDGTRVPMFITARKGLELDGDQPTLLYGYGGFSGLEVPGFSVFHAVWLERGGVLAIPNLRGGGEYGREWHENGKVLKKQNVFDDFIAAAEWLISNRYTRPERLAIRGGSNGGLLVGAAMTQCPNLFRVALPAVGVMDMLRFHLFTIGWAWVSDYGSPDNEEHFRALTAYSPLHNLKPGTRYPATLVTTGDHDDRVVPAHSFKFAARLQEVHAGEAPVLIRIETRAGHGAGKPVSKVIEEQADILAFAAAHVGQGSEAR